MLSLIAIAATVGGYPQAYQVGSGYGYAAQPYVATPYVQAQNYGYNYAAPTYCPKVVTAFVPIQQYEARTEIVGDQARAQQFAQARIQADTSLAQALAGITGELKSFREQVAQATRVQDQAFQVRQQAPPPVAQYPVQPSPQFQSPAPPSKSPPADYGQVPEPPQASPQVPAKGFPTLSPVNVPPPPTDTSQDQQGTFPTGPVQPQGPTQPQGFQAQPSGPLSPAMQVATATLYRRCGSCHSGGSPSGGLTIFATKDQLARTDPEFVRLLDRVAFTGYVAKRDAASGAVEKLKMPPSGRGFTAEEYASIRGMLAEVEETQLASNSQGNR